MKCDKCGNEVPSSNDATFVEAYALNSPLTALVCGARHFMPVFDEYGVMICEGSPSRAQYIEGQPRDTRGYRYLPENEAKWRAAWERLQKHCTEKNQHVSQ